jgi:hypothetical protein
MLSTRAGLVRRAEARTGRSEMADWQKVRATLVKEVRTHPFGYSVLAAFLVVGPVLAVLIFPEAPPAVAAAGGLAFGVYAALCAVPQKFM